MPALRLPSRPMPDTTPVNVIVLLESVNRKRCAKMLGVREGKLGVVSPYGNETAWRVEALSFQSFPEFCRRLEDAAGRNTSIVIRGKAVGLDSYNPAQGVPRRLVANRGIWEPADRTWIPIDFDDAASVGQTTEQRLLALAAILGEPFAGKSFWYQFTSQHNVSRPEAEGMRVRLWFLVDAPLSDRVLTDYLSPFRSRGVDVCLYRAVQPIYVATPTMEPGCEDPVPRRTGSIRGFDGDYVDAALLTALTPVRQPDAESTVAASVDIPANQTEIDNAIARILRGTTTNTRHNHALGAACELVALGATEQEISETLTDLFVQQGRSPDPTEVPRMIRWAQRKNADGSLTTSNPPLGLAFPMEDAAAVEVAPPPVPQPLAVPPTPISHGVLVSSMDEGDEATIIGNAAFSQNSNANAIVYIARALTDAENPRLSRFVVVGENDYWWTGTHYEQKEAAWLANRVQVDVNIAVEPTVRAIRRRAFVPLQDFPFWRDQKDTDPDPRFLVSFRNGVLDIREHMAGNVHVPLLGHDPRLFTINCLDYDYDPAAACPVFDSFLHSIFDNDSDRMEYLKMLGYAFLTDNPLHVIFFLSGVTRSGKGVTQRLMGDLVGRRAWASSSLGALSGSFGAANLVGTKLAFIGEMNEDAQARIDTHAVDLLKSISGGDAVLIDRKYREPINMVLGSKFVIACNTFPAVFDASGAFAGRVVLLRFVQSFLGRENRGLAVALRGELSGIANRALRALRQTMLHGFTPSENTQAYAADILSSSAPLTRFVEDVITSEPEAPAAFLQCDTVYAIYRVWCSRVGVSPKSLPRFASEFRCATPRLLPTRRGTRGGQSRGYTAPGLALTAYGNDLLAQQADHAPFN